MDINYWAFIGFIIGIVVGAGISFCVLWKPYNKGLNEGYDAGKRHSNNWDKGFHEGFYSAKEYYSDSLEKGFHDGWTACEKNRGEEE